ncbi:MAG TPA: pre-peptidase C-terminal domain-containing protein [Phormidium sp.]
MAVNLFDAKTYASLYPDLGAAGLTTPQQLENHFRTTGIVEGRLPSAFVSPTYYGRSYADLGRAGLTNNVQLFSHLENFGANEGRRSSVAFNPYFYGAVNTDLRSAGLTNEQLYQHFNVIGLSEGRASSEFFNAPFYLATYSDLKAAFGNDYKAALLHFVNFGVREGRVGSPAVSPSIDPSNVSSSAYDLGTLIAKGTFVDYVGGIFPTRDNNDYYGFRLDNTTNLNLQLSGFSAFVDFQLSADTNENGQFDPGEEIATNTFLTAPLTINKTLGAGYYHINISTPVGGTLYTLAMSPSAIPSTNTTDPGNNQANAVKLDITGSPTVTDFVGSTDRIDFYSFALGSNNTLNLSLNGTTDPAFALLYRDTNNNSQLDSTEILGIANSANNSMGTLTQNLDAGTYFVQVFTNTTTANTSYNMNLAV